MYAPRAFASSDLAQLDALVAQAPFVTLVTTDADGAPFASHLPVLYRRDGERILVEGHWARPNPQARHASSALVIVHGPQAYVSASWYPDKEPAARVPTWNYAVAHLSGRLETYEDEAGLADLVSRLSARFEASVAESWAFEPERQDHRAQLRGIVGFRLVPDRIALKFKLSQNHPLANREAVAKQLGSRDDVPGQAIATLMRGTLDPSSAKE